VILGGLSQIVGLEISFGESSSAGPSVLVSSLPESVPIPRRCGHRQILAILVEMDQSLRLPIEGTRFLLLDPCDFSQLDEKRVKTVQSFRPNMLHEHNAMDVCPRPLGPRRAGTFGRLTSQVGTYPPESEGAAGGNDSGDVGRETLKQQEGGLA
jgi:hypothetical protein